MNTKRNTTPATQPKVLVAPKIKAKAGLTHNQPRRRSKQQAAPQHPKDLIHMDDRTANYILLLFLKRILAPDPASREQAEELLGKAITLALIDAVPQISWKTLEVAVKQASDIDINAWIQKANQANTAN